MGAVSDPDHLYCLSCRSFSVSYYIVFCVESICCRYIQFAACALAVHGSMWCTGPFFLVTTSFSQKKDPFYSCTFCHFRFPFCCYGGTACCDCSGVPRGKGCADAENGGIGNAEKKSINRIAEDKLWFSAVPNHDRTPKGRACHAGKQ